MPNRPICAEDALLSETPMPPEQILRYLDRIGLRDAVPPPPTLETLRRLQSAHLLYVPYENLDLLRGAITSLEHGALFEKIVEKRRGGLCFELNGLFCWLLCSLDTRSPAMRAVSSILRRPASRCAATVCSS